MRRTLVVLVLFIVAASGCSKKELASTEADTQPDTEEQTSAKPDGAADSAVAETEHYHPKGKLPSKHTMAVLEKARASLPFADKKDFEEQKKGFIAAPSYMKIMADAGHVAWDMDRFQWVLEGEDFDSIHPSLERQAKLNMNYGLYEVIPGFYQVRGFDLANITFVKGKTGWIVFDPANRPGNGAGGQGARRRASG